MAHAEWANAVFFKAWGDSPARDLEEMRRRVGHIVGVQHGFLSILRGETPGTPPTGAPPSFDEIKSRAVTTHAGLREFTSTLKADGSVTDGASSVVSRSSVHHHGCRSARAGGHALSASPWAVHDAAQGFRRSAAERGLDHLAVEAEACGSVELNRVQWLCGRAQCSSAKLRKLWESKSPSMRIGIANDMGLAREALRRVVLSSPANEVAWMAKDGAEAVALARTDVPDLILMDLIMPGTDGVEATRRIMGESPCAILVVTATITGHLSKVYQAMGYGALDAIDTPTLGPRGEIAGAAHALAQDRNHRQAAGQAGGEVGPNGMDQPEISSSALLSSSWIESALDPLVVLGASTGGPQALAEVLSRASGHARSRHHHRSACRRGVCPGTRAVALRASTADRVLLAAEGHQPVVGEVLLVGNRRSSCAGRRSPPALFR